LDSRQLQGKVEQGFGLRMMEIPCFFCQAMLTGSGPTEMHYVCYSCSSKSSVVTAITTYRPAEQRVVRAHLYIKHKNKSYHIRYNLEDNKTYIMNESDENLIASVSGFPITPDNAEKKFKLILTFS
jgi:hypothetical protein